MTAKSVATLKNTLTCRQRAPSGFEDTEQLKAVSRGNFLLDIGSYRPQSLPLSESLDWFRGTVETFAQGASYLLAGQPGSRKSGLALQLALDLADQGLRTLFILTEEPSGRLRDRAVQMTQNWSGARVRRALANIHAEVAPLRIGGATAKPSRKSPMLRVVARRQTLEEERQFIAVMELFLADLVRRQLGGEKETS